MLNFLKQEANITFTENGAVTYRTTGSECLDLFAAIGALRHETDNEILARFIRAYMEDADMAMKLLFFARDVRGGLGERRVFRTILQWLAYYKADSVLKNMKYIAEYGRYDDLLVLLDTPCEKEMISLLKSQIEKDMEADAYNVSLLAKWLPSVNASNKATIRNAKKIARFLGMTDAEYRKAVSSLRKKIHIIENSLREKDYSFDYEKQPSRALFKYRNAFVRNDSIRYQEFMAKVNAGKAKLHADHVSPYELVETSLKRGVSSLSDDEKAALNATWNSLPDYGGDKNAIAVVDTSGSMYCYQNPMPASVALSLGLYFAERNKGLFKNHFIEFSERPQFIEIKGDSFIDRLCYIQTFHKVADTNLEAVFDLVLKAAVKNKISQDEMPYQLIIISDMEFNSCVRDASKSNFENAKEKYAANGYRLPNIVFWNVASRNSQQPVTMNEQGVVLVSGATPRLFEMVAEGNVSPYSLMLEVLSRERYAPIAA